MCNKEFIDYDHFGRGIDSNRKQEQKRTKRSDRNRSGKDETIVERDKQQGGTKLQRKFEQQKPAFKNISSLTDVKRSFTTHGLMSVTSSQSEIGNCCEFQEVSNPSAIATSPSFGPIGEIPSLLLRKESSTTNRDCFANAPQTPDNLLTNQSSNKVKIENMIQSKSTFSNAIRAKSDIKSKTISPLTFDNQKHLEFNNKARISDTFDQSALGDSADLSSMKLSLSKQRGVGLPEIKNKVELHVFFKVCLFVLFF
jgi:hypothetical protein